MFLLVGRMTKQNYINCFESGEVLILYSSTQESHLCCVPYHFASFRECAEAYSDKCFRTQRAITSAGLHARDQLTASNFVVYGLHTIRLASALIKTLNINQFVDAM
jgi:hypothetical protein